jgi:hypothetical protein
MARRIFSVGLVTVSLRKSEYLMMIRAPFDKSALIIMIHADILKHFIEGEGGQRVKPLDRLCSPTP